MMKWMRKHKKHMLAVFASALLVVWLGGTALEQMLRPNPLKARFGTAYGQSLTGADLQALQSKLTILERMGIPWRLPWRNPWVFGQLSLPAQMQMDPLMLAGARPLDRESGMVQWWLLDQEAQRMGITVSNDEVKEFLGQYGVTGQQLTQIRDQYNISTEALFATIAEYLRVSQAALLASASVQVTEPEVKDMFVRTNDQVSLRYAVIPASTFADQATQPVPQERLQALFDEYKDVAPGAGKYGIGYKVPERINVQFVGATVDDIARTLPPVSEDRARRYFAQHRDEFQPPAPPATTQPTTQPVVTFEQVQDQVMRQLRRDEAARQLRQAIDDISGMAFTEYLGSKSAAGEPGEAPATLEDVLKERRDYYSQSQNLPLVYHQTGLVTQDEAGSLTGIGRTSVPGSEGQPIPFAEYAFRVIRPDEQIDQHEEGIRFRMYQPKTVRQLAGDQTQAMYVFRVVGYEQAHAPASLADVREQVERDARMLDNLARAETVARDMLATAQQSNLQAAFAEQFPAQATQPVSTRPAAPSPDKAEMFEQADVPRARPVPPFMVFYSDRLTFPSNLPGLDEARPVLDAAFGQSGDDGASGNVAMVELPEQKAYAVVEVTGHTPATEQAFAEARPDLMAGMRFQKLRDFYADWYNPQMIEKRAGWQAIAQR